VRHFVIYLVPGPADGALRLCAVSVETSLGWRARYDTLVVDLRRQLSALPPGQPLRLAKSTSNLFRPRENSATGRLDVTAFDGVLHVDPDTNTAEVLGMTTYEHLVQATLPYGLMPLCVPQLKTITLGGAVTGLGIESASFRSGLPHESVIEMDILTGDGDVLTITPQADDPHRDLFFGFPNSYGSLGYALRLKIELEPTPDLVAGCAKVKRDDQTIVAFALEDPAVLETRAVEKMQRKKVDAILANPLQTMDARDIEPILFYADGRRDAPGRMAKTELAGWLIDQISAFSNQLN